MINKPLNIPGRRKVITKNMILEAQKHTKSNMEAARWMSVSYNTYKKWAKYYNVFEQHLNQEGIGIKKGYGKYRKPLDELLSSERKVKLTKGYLKKRLVEDSWAEEECSSCGYNEIVVNKHNVALLIDFIDGNNDNTSLNNIRLLCPNCYLSYNGHFPSSSMFYK